MSTDIAVIAERAGAVMLPDSDQWKNRLQIRSGSSSRLYTVAQRKSDGSWACSCFGWIRYRHCRHLDAMAPSLRMLS